MSKLFRVFFIMLIASVAFAQTNYNSLDTIKKDLDSIVVKDLTNNKLILAKDQDQMLRPASLTKIMTCLIAIQSGKMNTVVTITPEMTQVEPTKANFRVGEKIYLRDLVYAAMIKSANDAANAIAIYLGNGNKQAFVAMMNKEAKRIGMSRTNFTNPCGFDIGNHKTTAKDLLTLTEYAIKNSTFNSIVKMNHYAFRAINTNRKYVVYTSNRLMRQNKNVVGIKTGFTNGAGPCLIARAKNGNKDILLIMLNSHNRWLNAQAVINQTINTKTAKN